MTPTYCVFDFTLHSNVPIPGLTPVVQSAKTPDIELHLGHPPDSFIGKPTLGESLVYTSAYPGPSGEPALRIWRVAPGALYHLVYFDGMEFWIDERGTELWGVWPERSSLEDATAYLLGPVLGLLLRFRGVTCLHASAVVIEKATIAFVGAEGAGKSTTAAAFARSGFSFVSDDVVALVERDGEFWVSPAYPHLCLWPDSVELLYGSAEELPRLIPDGEKRRLAIGNGGLRFEGTALRLGAIYLLDDKRGEPGPYIEPVPAPAGFFSLVANSYATNMLDSEMRANEFKTLSCLVSKVPIRRLYANKGGIPPDVLCQMVREDFAGLIARP